MAWITIRLAEAADAARLNAALQALSADLGDTHRASDADILDAGFGAMPAFRSLIALDSGTVVGAALFSPLYSTTLGGAGAYVSDFWIEGTKRGTGLAPRLLAATRDEARTHWGARFLRLSVYADNPRAAAFYERIGFTARPGEVGMILAGPALEAIGDNT